MVSMTNTTNTPFARTLIREKLISIIDPWLYNGRKNLSLIM